MGRVVTKVGEYSGLIEGVEVGNVEPMVVCVCIRKRLKVGGPVEGLERSWGMMQARSRVPLYSTLARQTPVEVAQDSQEVGEKKRECVKSIDRREAYISFTLYA